MAPIIHPELAARVTSASAALADFRREDFDYTRGGGPQPSWQGWALRLAAELKSLLAAIGGAS